MGYVDSIVAGKQNASQFNYAISPNRELTALGIGMWKSERRWELVVDASRISIANLGASLVSGSIPGYGSITRSR